MTPFSIFEAWECKRTPDELSHALHRLKRKMEGNPDAIIHASGDIYTPGGSRLGNVLVD